MTLQASEFTAYGPSHLGAVVVLAVGIVVIVVAGRRLDDPDDRLGKGLALACLLTTVPLQALWFAPARWDVDTSLPVQLCDLASLTAIYALWTHRRWAAALTYYWGITLTTQAIATPALTNAFPDPIFLLFWAMHIGTVWAAVHLTWSRGIRPHWRGYCFAVAVTAIWAVAVYCLNLLLDTNYGYLNRKPATASILDLLGPWPWYVAAEVAIIAVVWAGITRPWVGRRAVTDRREPAGS